MSKRRSEYAPPNLRRAGLTLSGEALIGLMRAVHEKGRSLRFRAGGHSMAPFMRDGDIVSVSPLGPYVPGLGEVVAFIHPETGLLCLHRVVAVGADGFLIQGDNTPGRPDGRVAREAIIGRVTRVERAGRRIGMGLGPERVLLALLSRSGGLAVIRRLAGALTGRFSRGEASCARP